MSTTTLIFRYSVFAIIAIIANLMAQRIVFALLDGNGWWLFPMAVFFGTLVGLVIKYILDKRWIFYDMGSGIKQHGQKFTLYTLMGIITTLIFWSSETLFWLIWGSEFMREAGALIGLTIGYVIKYRLDKKFVFDQSKNPFE